MAQSAWPPSSTSEAWRLHSGAIYDVTTGKLHEVVRA